MPLCCLQSPMENNVQKCLQQQCELKNSRGFPPRCLHLHFLSVSSLISLSSLHASDLHLSLSVLLEWLKNASDHLLLARQIFTSRFKEQHVSLFLLLLLLSLIRQFILLVTGCWKQNHVHHLNISMTHILHMYTEGIRSDYPSKSPVWSYNMRL